ncbi:hypothetical protein LshimejAT787_0208080 [Lyophyllum shimeji]|uniref:Uncharacterized protein n=1 Tax=Lyophyllum shimeji TaxID=47721 RepID=A0A9P3UJ34_LYOSH|nr:hypothetical protein LshimejAT787_0208080 [Lyophyllum shimeji]
MTRSLFGSNRDDEDKDDAPPAVEENLQPQPAVEEDPQPVPGDGNGYLEQPEQPEEDINPPEPKVEEPHAKTNSTWVTTDKVPLLFHPVTMRQTIDQLPFDDPDVMPNLLESGGKLNSQHLTQKMKGRRRRQT